MGVENLPKKMAKNVVVIFTEDEMDDRELVLRVVRQNGASLQYASFWLKSDREVVLAAVSNCGASLQHASSAFTQDREVVIAAVSNGSALKFASNELKSDREVVLAAVRKSGYELAHVSEELMNDREIVLAAVNQSGHALYYASNELKNDKGIVLAALANSGIAVTHVSNELKEDVDVAVVAFRHQFVRRSNFPSLSKSALIAHISELLSAHNTFLNSFLTGFLDIEKGSSNKCAKLTADGDFGASCINKKCRLLILKRLGLEELLAVKKLIADYVGISYGIRYSSLNTALANITEQFD
jgi:hypothetical protein